MNLIQQQEMIKSFSDKQIANEMQHPSGQVPLYLVTSEANRRADLRQRFKQEETGPPPATTVHEDLLNNILAAQVQPPQGQQAMPPQGQQAMPPQGQQVMPPQGQQQMAMASPQQGGIMAGVPQMPPANTQGFRDGGGVRGFAGRGATNSTDPLWYNEPFSWLYGNTLGAWEKSKARSILDNPNSTDFQRQGANARLGQNTPALRIPRPRISPKTSVDDGPITANIPTPPDWVGPDGGEAKAFRLTGPLPTPVKQTPEEIKQAKAGILLREQEKLRRDAVVKAIQRETDAKAVGLPVRGINTKPIEKFKNVSNKGEAFDTSLFKPVEPTKVDARKEGVYPTWKELENKVADRKKEPFPELDTLKNDVDPMELRAAELARLRGEGTDPYAKLAERVAKRRGILDKDKKRNVGFTLMDIGARMMGGKSQYAMQNIGDAVPPGLEAHDKRKEGYARREDSLLASEMGIVSGKRAYQKDLRDQAAISVADELGKQARQNEQIAQRNRHRLAERTAKQAQYDTDYTDALGKQTLRNEQITQKNRHAVAKYTAMEVQYGAKHADDVAKATAQDAANRFNSLQAITQETKRQEAAIRSNERLRQDMEYRVRNAKGVRTREDQRLDRELARSTKLYLLNIAALERRTDLLLKREDEFEDRKIRREEIVARGVSAPGKVLREMQELIDKGKPEAADQLYRLAGGDKRAKARAKHIDGLWQKVLTEIDSEGPTTTGPNAGQNWSQFEKSFRAKLAMYSTIEQDSIIRQYKNRFAPRSGRGSGGQYPVNDKGVLQFNRP